MLVAIFGPKEAFLGQIGTFWGKPPVAKPLTRKQFQKFLVLEFSDFESANVVAFG